jgi:hypothetical protein
VVVTKVLGYLHLLLSALRLLPDFNQVLVVVLGRDALHILEHVVIQHGDQLNSRLLAVVSMENSIFKGNYVFEVLLVDGGVELLEFVVVLGHYFDRVFSV